MIATGAYDYYTQQQIKKPVSSTWVKCYRNVIITGRELKKIHLWGKISQSQNPLCRDGGEEKGDQLCLRKEKSSKSGKPDDGDNSGREGAGAGPGQAADNKLWKRHGGQRIPHRQSHTASFF